MVTCPICSWTGSKFSTYGEDNRPNALCPQCRSLERQRLYYLYLKEYPPQGLLLHVGPEECLATFFRSLHIRYLSVDIDKKKAMVQQDITKMTFKDNVFDFIFCSHVLDDVKDDKTAISELFRVLRPGGIAILQVPIYYRFFTREDFSVQDKEKRLKQFMRTDDYRLYGKWSYIRRLKQVGFRVKVDKFFYGLKKEAVKRFGLLGEDIFVCRKN